MIRRPASLSRTPRALAVSAVAVTAIGLTGCSEMSPQTTTLKYDAADGVSTTVGSVDLQDVVLISGGKKGGAAKLSGLATNSSSRAVEVTVGTSGKGGQKFTVPARGVVRLDGKANGDSTDRIKAVEIPKLENAAGESATLAFTAASAGQVHLLVPVLLDQYPYGTQTVHHPTAEGGEEGGH